MLVILACAPCARHLSPTSEEHLMRTVAILAQGTSWAVAATQAFFCQSGISGTTVHLSVPFGVVWFGFGFVCVWASVWFDFVSGLFLAAFVSVASQIDRNAMQCAMRIQEFHAASACRRSLSSIRRISKRCWGLAPVALRGRGGEVSVNTLCPASHVDGLPRPNK